MIRTCAACGASNRIPAAHLADTGKCGACKAELPPVDAPLDVDAAQFDEIVASAKVPVLVDFWAEWCGPCKRVAPQVALAAKQLAGKALVLKVDTEKHGDVAGRFGVQGIPNFLVLKGGNRVFQQPGAVDAATLVSYVQRAG